MRRSKKALIALLLLLGVVALVYTLSPLADGRWGKRQLRIDDLSRRSRYVLEAEEGKGTVYAIDLQWRGTLDGKVVLRLAPPGDELLVRQVLPGGKVHAKYKGDWYARSCELIVEPEPGTSGELVVYYDFSYLPEQ